MTWPTDDSLWRYETLAGLVLDAYGTIDTDKGRALVDYLHPPNYGYYDEDSQYVGGVRALFDLTHRRMWALYGLWTDSWVEDDL